MICLASQSCPPVAARAVDTGPAATREHPSLDTHPGPRPVGFRGTDAALPQLRRFILVGGISTALYALLFVSLYGLGFLPAHLTATVASSVLANELHRRLTFGAEERVHFLAAQLEAGTVSVLGLVASSAALIWLQATVAGAPAAVQIGLVATVTALVGAMRFVALRWIFRPATSEA